MINVTRSQPPPESLLRGKHDGEDTLRCLHEDFLEKCYLCEASLLLRDLEVDHREGRNNARRLDWSNLYPAHGHCNNVRPRKYPDDGLLFPADGDDVEARLVQEIRIGLDEHEPFDFVFHEREDTDLSARNTAQELKHVHYATASRSPASRMKARELRKAIAERVGECLLLREAVRNGDAPERNRERLTRRLSRSAPYTALLRSVLGDMYELFD